MMMKQGFNMIHQHKVYPKNFHPQFKLNLDDVVEMIMLIHIKRVGKSIEDSG